jgi:dTDP-4-dehydrorhamnose 3,5-epimerase-like enzyme
MIKFIKNYFEHKDEKGSIRGLVNFGQWEEINIIESEAGVKRGNHYHKYTQELFIILEGRIKILLQKVINNQLVGEIKEYEVQKGDVFLIETSINHIFIILEKSRWINVLSKKIEKQLTDIIRV